MSLAFVCDQCETELQTGLMACPHCGQPFDTPVPDVAQYQETAPEDAGLPYSVRSEASAPSAAAPAPDPMPVPLPQMPPPDHIGRTVTLAIAVILAACLVWLWRNGAFTPGGGYLPSSLSHLLGH